MDYFNALMVITLATTMSVVSGQSPSIFPESLTEESGNTAQLNCSLDETNRIFVWAEFSSGRIFEGSNFTGDARFDNFEVSSVSESGATTSTLTISDIQLEDEGLYFCAEDRPRSPFSALASVIVEVRSELTVTVETLREGVEATAQCDAVGGAPQETLTWYIDDMVVTSERVQVTNPTNPTQGLTNTRSVYTFTPTAADNGQTLSCRITGHSLPQLNQRMDVTLDVQLRAAPTSDSIAVTVQDQGASLLVTCSITADPPPHPSINSYVIHQDGDVISNSNTAIVSPVPFPGSCTNFTCTASNELGNATTMGLEYCQVELTLQVDTDRGILAAGDTSQARCTAVGARLPQNIIWFIGNRQITTGIVSSESDNPIDPRLTDTVSELTFTPTTADHESVLRCVTSFGTSKETQLRVWNLCLRNRNFPPTTDGGP